MFYMSSILYFDEQWPSAAGSSLYIYDVYTCIYTQALIYVYNYTCISYGEQRVLYTCRKPPHCQGHVGVVSVGREDTAVHTYRCTAYMEVRVKGQEQKTPICCHSVVAGIISDLVLYIC